MEIKPRKLTTGRESVVYGNVSGNVGDYSVVIGPTDQYGNTVLNTSMAIGHGAIAGPGSIAIGAGATAGVGLPQLINALSEAVEASGDNQIASQFNEFVAEVSGENGTPRKERILSVLDWLRGAASLNGAMGLIDRLVLLFHSAP